MVGVGFYLHRWTFLWMWSVICFCLVLIFGMRSSLIWTSIRGKLRPSKISMSAKLRQLMLWYGLTCLMVCIQSGARITYWQQHSIRISLARRMWRLERVYGMAFGSWRSLTKWDISFGVLSVSLYPLNLICTGIRCWILEFVMLVVTVPRMEFMLCAYLDVRFSVFLSSCSSILKFWWPISVFMLAWIF